MDSQRKGEQVGDSDRFRYFTLMKPFLATGCYENLSIHIFFFSRLNFLRGPYVRRGVKGLYLVDAVIDLEGTAVFVGYETRPTEFPGHFPQDCTV